MKHFKKLTEFEKKFKIAEKLEIVAIWTQEVIKSIFYGFIAFCVFALIISNISVSIFIGTFIAYMFIGFKVSERAKPAIGFDFCVYNGKFALLMIIIAIIALATSSSITIITWPLLAAGVVLLIATFIGIFGISLANYYEE